jgi:hypothetical protein
MVCATAARAHVARETPNIEALAAELVHGGLETPFAHIPGGYAAAFGREPLGDRQADAARGAGHDANDALKTPRLHVVHGLSLLGAHTYGSLPYD